MGTIPALFDSPKNTNGGIHYACRHYKSYYEIL